MPPKSQKSALYFYAREMGAQRRIPGTIMDLIEAVYTEYFFKILFL
jgi:hypothetical protein